MPNVDKYIFAVTTLTSRWKRKKIKILPHSNGHEFEAHWTTLDKDLSKMKKYTLIPGLSMNFILGFNYVSTPSWSENWFRRWVLSNLNPHPRPWTNFYQFRLCQLRSISCTSHNQYGQFYAVFVPSQNLKCKGQSKNNKSEDKGKGMKSPKLYGKKELSQVSQ